MNSVRAAFSIVSAAVFAGVAACGSDSGTDSAHAVTVVDKSITLGAADACDSGGEDVDFLAVINQTVTIVVSGASTLTPRFTLYAPDFSTQVGSSFDNGGGKAKLVTKLVESGTFHLTVCEATGKPGTVRVLVTHPFTG
ncbi:MAG TPA: hypothetical protein VE967_12955 [Gemmatimonadaceae bacterium]|nr:hypothetical protein [Gemmatimonadaceae bacterium]